MALSNLEILKINIQEINNDTFTDEELNNLLEVCENNVNKASWRACLLKANTDKKIVIGPIEIQSFDPDYWNNLANIYYQDYISEKSSSSSRYINNMTRCDEI